MKVETVLRGLALLTAAPKIAHNGAMRLQPDLCPKCGLDMLPFEPRCPSCAMGRRHNLFIAAFACLVALAAFGVFRMANAPRPKAQLPAPIRVTVATPAPTRTPIVIQDAPFSYNADVSQFAAPSSPRLASRSPRSIPRQRAAVRQTAPLMQMPRNEYSQPVPQSKAERVQNSMKKLVQMVRDTDKTLDLLELRVHAQMTRVEIQSTMRKALNDNNTDSYNLSQAIDTRLDMLEQAIASKLNDRDGNNASQTEALLAQAASP